MTDPGRIDPELLPATVHFHKFPPLNTQALAATREISARMIATKKAQVPVAEGVEFEDLTVPGPPGGPEVPVRIYTPEAREAELPALLWCHHGGFVMGGLDSDHHATAEMAKAANCMVVSVDYRMAPEHPYPAPLEDCYAALKWLHGEAEHLGVDQARIAIGGLSAGGGALAAGLTLLARDRGKVPITFQLLLSPMLDDSNILQAGKSVVDTLVWKRSYNLFSWTSYLNREPGGDGIDYYAAAARAKDLTGLPPTFISVGDIDLFAQENLTYAGRLITANVPVEMHVYSGAYHGFESQVLEAEVSKRSVANRDRALRRALTPWDNPP